jgi:hypothetical protein
LLVNFAFDATILSVHAIAVDEHATVSALARSDAGTYVGGNIIDIEGGVLLRFVARLAL